MFVKRKNNLCILFLPVFAIKKGITKNIFQTFKKIKLFLIKFCLKNTFF